MAKINILATLENKTENKFFNTDVKGLYNNNRIVYRENDTNVIIEIINKEEIRITRNHNNYKVIIPLKYNDKKEGTYHLNKLGDLYLSTKCYKLEINTNKIVVHYELSIENCNATDFQFTINLTKEEE